MAQEQIFFQENGVLVSTSRFSYGGQTYAMANVTSVRSVASSIGGRVLLLLIGIGLTPALPPLGILIAVAAIVALFFRARFVVLHTSGAEQRALKSTDKQFVERVVSAVNQAMVARG